MARVTRPIPGYEGVYEASDQGEIISIPRRNTRGGVLSQQAGPYAYLQVFLYKDGKRTTKRVHVLVASAFFGPRPEGLEVRHLNGDSRDNRVVNLAYGTSSENKDDQRLHGTHHNAVKTSCKNGHEFDEANTITHNGNRACRTCRNARRREKRAQ